MLAVLVVGFFMKDNKILQIYHKILIALKQLYVARPFFPSSSFYFYFSISVCCCCCYFVFLWIKVACDLVLTNMSELCGLDLETLYNQRWEYLFAKKKKKFFKFTQENLQVYTRRKKKLKTNWLRWLNLKSKKMLVLKTDSYRFNYSNLLISLHFLGLTR